MNRKLSLILLLACTICFVAGIAQLFKLRFETGDVYPAYSSLRSDPLGTSALYESLGRIPDLTVSRDFRMTDQLPEGKDIAYLHLAGSPDDWEEIPEQSFKEIEAFVKRGGRLVVAFLPETTKTFESSASRWKTTPSEKSKDKDTSHSKRNKSAKKKKMIGDEDSVFKTVSLTEHWGVGFEFRSMKQGDSGVYQPFEVKNHDEPSLPDSMLWHSGLVLVKLDDAWNVIYSRDSHAVLAERKFGAGSVVFATDSYFLSNEALGKDRHLELLSWILGPSRQIIFDEAHLGIVDNPGVATLMRNYRLHGLMAGLLLLAGLFIWKNSVSFVPAHGYESVENAVAGKDSTAGFVNLLRRHIKTADLLNLCVAEWRKSFAQGKSPSTRLERIQSVIDAQNALPPNERTPVATYRAICQALKEPGAKVIQPQFGTPNPEPGNYQPL